MSGASGTVHYGSNKVLACYLKSYALKNASQRPQQPFRQFTCDSVIVVVLMASSCARGINILFCNWSCQLTSDSASGTVPLHAGKGLTCYLRPHTYIRTASSSVTCLNGEKQGKLLPTHSKTHYNGPTATVPSIYPWFCEELHCRRLIVK